MIGADHPVSESGAVLVAGTLEDMEAGDICGSNVGVDLVERSAVETELGECLYHGRAIALTAVLVGDDEAYGSTTIDGVVVV